MRRELGNLMNHVLEFRNLCKKYLLTSAEGELPDDDDVISDGGRYGVPNRRSVEKLGMGLLKVNSPQFMQNLTLCNQELATLKQRFDLTMNILMRALALTENKAGEIKFLNEAFIRLNFNYFYIPR